MSPDGRWAARPTAIGTEATIMNCPLHSGLGDAAISWRPLDSLRLGLRIHIMGDIPETAESLAALFRLEGHQVEVTLGQMSGEVGAIEGRPDMVLFDLSLPGANEWLLDSQARDSASEKAPFRIGLLGHGQRDIAGSRARDGLHLHLALPVDRGLLVKLARRLQAIILPGGVRQHTHAVTGGKVPSASWRHICPEFPLRATLPVTAGFVTHALPRTGLENASSSGAAWRAACAKGFARAGP